MGIIGQQMFAIDHPHEWDYAHAQDTEHHWDVARLTNVESIADASGIPRETVRRKVSILISKGWVRRTEKGGLFVTLDAVKALTPQTEAALDLQDVMFSALALGLVDDGKITVAPSIREIDSGGAGLDPPCSG